MRLAPASQLGLEMKLYMKRELYLKNKFTSYIRASSDCFGWLWYARGMSGQMMNKIWLHSHILHTEIIVRSAFPPGHVHLIMGWSLCSNVSLTLWICSFWNILSSAWKAWDAEKMFLCPKEWDSQSFARRFHALVNSKRLPHLWDGHAVRDNGCNTCCLHSDAVKIESQCFD